MRFKKIVSGLLACAMIATSAFTGNASVVSAQTPEPEAKITRADAPVPVSSYNFDIDVSDDDAQPSLGEGVEAFTAGLAGAASVGTDAFVAGRSGAAGDKALDLGGKFGIRLPDKNIGADYTVSMWVKRTDAITNNFTPVLWLGGTAGYIAAAGAWHESGTTEECIVWGGGLTASEEPHFTLAKNEWDMLTIAQSGETLSIYKNGECLKTITKAGLLKPLDGADMQIYVGVNLYPADGLFKGIVDDIDVYNEALTAEQISELYDPRTDEEKFALAELEVSPSFHMVVGKTRKVQVALPAGISENKMNVSFASADPAIAEVNAATGEITAKAEGETEITTTVALKESAAAPKTKKTVVTVTQGNGKELAVDYDFETSEGTVLKDKSGNGHNAAIHGATAKFENGALTLQGGSKDTANPDYVDIPKSILDELDDQEQFTIEVEFAKGSNIENAWLFCLGATPAGTGYNYLFLSPNFGTGTLRSGIKGNQGGSSAGEKLFGTSIKPETNKSYTVNMVFDNGRLSLYWNGIKIKGDQGEDYIDSGYSIMDDIVEKGCPGDILGYIGKSCWSGDGYFKGSISKFKIYNKAMTDDEVQGAFAPTFDRIFKEDMKVANILGSNESADAVRYNLSLPTEYEEAPITWTSDKPEIITNAGIVNNPTAAVKVKMTAKVVSGKLEGTTELEVTVQPADKTALNAKIAEAETELQNKFRSENSKEEIRKLIAKGNAATGQTEIDKLVSDINKLLKKMEYSPLYVNPFTELEDFNPAVSEMISLAPNASATVKAADVPEIVKDAVDVAYESLAEDIAIVDGDGKVTGKNIGYAMIVTKISAKYDNYTQEYYTIVKVDVNLSGVKASAAKTLLAKGKTTQVKVTVPSSIKGAKTTYRATGAVSVNKSGKVTAKSAGTGKVYVKVSVAGKSITKTVTVNVVELTGAASVKIKKSAALKVNGPKGMKVKWSLDKKGSKLAKITKKGKLTAKKAGKVTVTAKVTVGKASVTLTKKVSIKKK